MGFFIFKCEPSRIQRLEPGFVICGINFSDFAAEMVKIVYVHEHCAMFHVSGDFIRTPCG